jgi:ribonuclease P protein component
MIPGTPSEPPRIAFAVARSVGNAPARNRLRRRLRAAVRAQAGALAPGARYLVSVGPAAAEISYRELEAHVGGALRAAGSR